MHEKIKNLQKFNCPPPLIIAPPPRKNKEFFVEDGERAIIRQLRVSGKKNAIISNKNC